MGSAAIDRLGMVRTLIATAPDSAVRSLDLALRGEGPGDSLSSIRTLVRDELADRAVRDSVDGPVLPLCTPRADGFTQALFPAGVLPRLWRALKQMEPQSVSLASASLSESDPSSRAFDELCRTAASALRESRAEMASVAKYLEDFRAGAALQFAGFLELAPLAREAIRRLPAWLRNMTNDNAAAIRLLFKDADEIATDAGPRLMEILMAQLKEPWLILRVISAVTGRASDRYLSSSELSEFCQRVLVDIDRRVAVAQAFDFDGGVDAGAAVAQALNGAVIELVEFEEALELAKDGPWGPRVSKLKAAVASLAEACLKKCAKIVGEALPLQPVRIGGTVVRFEPRVDALPDPRLVRRAMAATAFYEKVRTSAAQGGYGSARKKTGEEVCHRLDSYIEDMLSMMHSGDVEHTGHARAYLEAAASLMAMAQDEEAARIVRRRAAAA